MDKTEKYMAVSILCGFMSKVFLHSPEVDQLNQFDAGELLSEWALEGDVKALGERFSKVVEKEQKNIKSLQDDYHSLFVHPESSVPMWESVWTTKERLLFGEPTFEVRELYNVHGLAAPNINIEPDDHIGLELGFMAYLFLNAAQAESVESDRSPELYVNDAREFAQNHLSKWALPCLVEVRSKASTEYYRRFAEFCAAVIGSLEDVFAE
ncbi:hypothetical protein D0S45_16815 [Marinifilum sp. JC120]|nr:hypothetical protein D0S45_16815 [Marinifilum sp. JC120]